MLHMLLATGVSLAGSALAYTKTNSFSAKRLNFVPSATVQKWALGTGAGVTAAGLAISCIPLIGGLVGLGTALFVGASAGAGIYTGHRRSTSV